MNKTNVLILDTGCANLGSVRCAFEKMGVQAKVSHLAEDIRRADKLIFPGVGTTEAAMRALTERGLIDLLAVATQPVLGICLGMQLLTKRSEEGAVDCLGLIATECQKLVTSADIRVPHMGWNETFFEANHPLFKNIKNGEYFYYVHSYAVPVGDFTIATCEHGAAFSAAIARDNFMGVQFHPERSSAAGAQLLKNFVNL
jgi:glutamine amidotransferase